MSFIAKFQKWFGPSEVPEVYLRWAALSLIAACLSRRVWTPRQHGSRILRLHPNLYTILVGPSGNGKSLAQDAAMLLLRQAHYKGIINLYTGKTSAPAMYDAMKPTSKGPERPFIYLVHDELANDIGIGEMADLLVKSLTRMYFGTPFKDSTRTYGDTVLDMPYLVNWFACSVPEWLVRAVSRAAILGGFFARTCVISAGYLPFRLEPNRSLAKDNHLLEAALVAEVNRFLQLSGEFHRSPALLKRENDWVMSRPLYDERDPMSPTRKREYDLALKLETALAVSDGTDYEILPIHFDRAIELVDEASQAIPELAEMSRHSQDYLISQELLSIIREAGTIQHYKLARFAHRRGIDAIKLRGMVQTWVQAGWVEEEIQARQQGGVTYRFLQER